MRTLLHPLVAVLFSLMCVVQAQEELLPARPSNFIDDQLSLLSPKELSSLSKELLELESKFGVELYLQTLPKAVQDLSDYGQKLLPHWQKKPLSIIVLTDVQKQYAIYHSPIAKQYFKGMPLPSIIAQTQSLASKYPDQKERILFITQQLSKELKFMAYRAAKHKQDQYNKKFEEQQKLERQKSQKRKLLFGGILLGLLFLTALLTALFFQKKKKKPLLFPEVNAYKRLGGSRAGGTTYAHQSS